MSYRAAIFDFDGTLCNTLPDLAAAGNYALEQLGFSTHDPEKYRYFVGEGVVRLMERILPEGHRDKDTVERLRKIYKEYYKTHIDLHTRPYDGIKELLALLWEKNVQLCVLSNKDDADTKRLCKHFFPGVFEIVRGAQPDKPRKPAPDVPFEIAAELGCEPWEIVFVGDSKFDIQTANNARMDSCGVLWGFRDRAELSEAGATYIVEKPCEILTLF